MITSEFKNNQELEHWLFITMTVHKFVNLFSNFIFTQIILDSLNYFTSNNKLSIGAYVIMPNHIHLIVKPEKDTAFENINRDFKKYTSQNIIFRLKENNNPLIDKFIVNKKDRRIQIWKRNTHKKQVFSSEFMKQKVEYIHNNPCQPNWRLVDKPEDYRYSSASFYLTDEKPQFFSLFDLRKIISY